MLNQKTSATLIRILVDEVERNKTGSCPNCGSTQTAMQEAFDTFDTDSSGSIDRTELKGVLKKLGLITSEEWMMDEAVENVMTKFDKDHSNCIDFEEFSKMYTIVKSSAYFNKELTDAVNRAFPVSSEFGVSHPSMGSSSVLNGCPVEDHYGGVCVLLIDPQNDFHPPNGSLAVPGAIEDSETVMKLIQERGSKLSRCVVTLDTHHRMHIAHGAFWMGKDGKSPAPFTQICAADIQAGTWTARQEELQVHVVHFAHIVFLFL